MVLLTSPCGQCRWHTRHGLLEEPGMGVLVKSAAIGESARRQSGTVIISTSCCKLWSYATHPLVAISLNNIIMSQRDVKPEDKHMEIGPYFNSSTMGSASSKGPATLEVEMK